MNVRNKQSSMEAEIDRFDKLVRAGKSEAREKAEFVDVIMGEKNINFTK